ncbi:MAG: uroporphyrinogen-III synthase, partial [Pseudomonadota bacterium]|nr:uroporphyrinogen-III synthase [Pseudomonadota bacterium]
MSQPVLICRPGERGETLADALRASEGWVESLVVVHLEARPEDATQRQVWLDIDQYHKIVVVSPFAAYCLSEALDRYWPQRPIGIDYYSVGRGTASILFDQLGVRVRIPPPQQGEDTSEALLSLASLRHLA